MSTAEQLAAGLLAAQARQREAGERERARLLEERAELAALVGMSGDVGALERRRAELESELAGLEGERGELERRRDELAAASPRARLALWERVSARCAALLDAAERERAGQNFYSAVEAFAAELAEEGLSVAAATPAQLRKQLPRLREAAERARAAAAERAADISASLANAPAVSAEQERLEQERRAVEQAVAETLARLRAHCTAEQLGLAEDLAAADARVLKRLRREVFEPLLADARIERERGLAGHDPLAQLDSLIAPR